LSLKAKKVKEKYEEQLLKYTGVTGVSYNHSLIVYVEKATPQLKRLIPKTLNGVKVRIIETGKIVPLPLTVPIKEAVYSARTGRYRPAPGGVSVGHKDVTAGTLTCRAIDRKTGEGVGLSNNHVCALQWGTDHIGNKGDPILQPGPYDGGGPDDKIGELERWVPVELEPKENLIDAAIFRSDQLAEEVTEVGEIRSSVEAQVGMNLLKSGRTSGLNFSQVYDVNATVKVSGAGDCIFKDQIIAMPAFLEPGDSGSWVGCADTYKTVGLGFAGSGTVSIINKAAHVENLLDIDIVPPAVEPPYVEPVKSSLPLLAACGLVFGMGAQQLWKGLKGG